MKPTQKYQKQIYTTGTVLLLSAQLLSCSESTALNQSSTTVTDLASGITKLHSVVSGSTPQVKPTSTLVTWTPVQKMKKYWKDFHFFPSAVASVSGLAAIWGTPSVSPSGTPALVSLNNIFLGGASTGVTQGATTTTCTGPSGSPASPDCPAGTYNNQESLVDYISQEMTPTFHNTNGASTTLFGRLNSALGIPCVIGHLIPNIDTDGLPSVGVQSFTMPADGTNVVYQSQSSGGCGMATSMAGRTLTVTVSAVTGSRYYNKKMTLNAGNPIVVYMKLDLANGIFNMMNVEDQRGSGRYAVDRSIINMTGMNTSGGTTIALEYISTGSQCSGVACGGGTTEWNGSSWQVDFEFHRVFIDQANDVGYLLSTDGTPGDSSGSVSSGGVANRVIFTAAGKPNEIAACSDGSCSQDIAMSVGFVGQKDGNGGTTIGQATNSVNTTDYDGCVNVGSIDVAIDNVTTCNGLAVSSAASAATPVDTIRAYYSADVVVNLLNTSTSTYGLAFTNGSDIYTATY